MLKIRNERRVVAANNHRNIYDDMNIYVPDKLGNNEIDTNCRK